MRQATILIFCLLVAATWAPQTDASLDRFLFRRQTEGEQEGTTTPKSTQQNQSPPQAQQTNGNNNNGRLYPDVPHAPNFIPPFNAPPHHAQPPFVPFGLQMPGGNGPPLRLNADQQPAPFGRLPGQPRPVSPVERLQSQTFTDGLGKRLLSMIGIDLGNQTAAPEAGAGATPGPLDPATMRALQNATVLERLSRQVSSLMGGLSKMYNSTVQEQLSLLNERFMKSSENDTNPWQQRMAERIPIYFKNIAARVGRAQEQLDRVWHDVTQAARGNSSVLRNAGGRPNDGLFGSFNQFMGPDRMNFFGGGGGGGGTGNGGGFVDQVSRSLGFPPATPGEQQMAPSAQQGNVSNQQHHQQRPDMAMRLREFWQMQVQPQVGMLRGQMARVWRDLTTSGALSHETIARSRSDQMIGGVNSARNSSASSDLVDSILKEIEIDSNSEYSLVDAKGETAASTAESGDAPTATAAATPPKDDKEPAGGKMMTKLSPQMQNRLVDMQRDLNQLWMGLTKSLQGALANVRTSMGAQPSEPMASSSNHDADPKQNEIDDKISELSKLQRDADAVQRVVQQQQQQQQQQRPSLGDRFRGFVNNVDTGGMNQLPERIGEQFNRFGSALGNFWNQIPERWDNLVSSSRQPTNHDSMMMA